MLSTAIEAEPICCARKCDKIYRIRFLAVFACFLWSSAFVGIKIGLKFADPFFFAGIRFMISGLLLLPFWWRHRPSFSTFIKYLPSIILFSFFQTFILYAMLYSGMKNVSGAITAIIIGSSPLWAAVLSHILMPSDHLSTRRFLSLLVGVAGVVLIILGKENANNVASANFTGILLILGACCSSALGNIIFVKKKLPINPIFQNSVQIFIGGLGLYIISLLFEKGFIGSSELPIKYFWFSLVWLSTISAIAFSIWFSILKEPNVKVSELNLWKFIIPVSGAILSWVILPNESPTIVSIIGMLCIATSIVLFNYFSSKNKTCLCEHSS